MIRRTKIFKSTSLLFWSYYKLLGAKTTGAPIQCIYLIPLLHTQAQETKNIDKNNKE